MPSPASSSPPPPGHALRAAARAAFWTLTLLALPAALLTTAAWFDVPGALLAQLSPFRVQYAVLLGAHALFCLLLRRCAWAACFAAFALFNTLVVVAALRPARTAPAPAPGGPAPVKILFANVLTSNPDPRPLLDLIAAEKPDLVALLEINAHWRAALEPALAADYPWRFFQAREDNFGLAVLSRVPPAGGRVEFFADVETPSFDFVLPRPDGPWRVLVTHPLPPGDAASAALRDQHLTDLEKWVRFVAGLATETTPRLPVLILGDLNATPWCPPLRGLLRRADLRRAAADHGLLAATWPVTVPFLAIPLDHALLGAELACPAYRVGPDIGSDHRPLILEVARAAALPSP